MAVTEAVREELFERVVSKDLGLTVDETVGGLALVVLGILALVGIYPALLTSIATILSGVAVVFMSMGVNREFNNALAATGHESLPWEPGSFSGGTIAGIAGIVLGVLAVLDVARPTLIAVSLIVFGAAVFLDFIVTTQTRIMRMTRTGASPGNARMVPPAADNAEMASILFAISLVVLGILAITGVRSESLIAVAFLSFGSYMFLKGIGTAGYLFGRERPAVAQ